MDPNAQPMETEDDNLLYSDTEDPLPDNPQPQQLPNQGHNPSTHGTQGRNVDPPMDFTRQGRNITPTLRINASEVDLPLTRDRFQCRIEIDLPDANLRTLGSGNVVQVKTFGKSYVWC